MGSGVMKINHKKPRRGVGRPSRKCRSVFPFKGEPWNKGITFLNDIPKINPIIAAAPEISRFSINTANAIVKSSDIT